jgi:ABC-type uncharacterized transport system involved in gliding motility auxiliary subunit
LSRYLIIIVLVNVLFARVNFRLDVTGDKIYSLSEGTKKILENIPGNVSIKFFYSRSLDGFPPQLKAYAGKVIDFLSEYEFHSGKKITVEVYDPKPDSEEEEWARKFGIEGINLPERRNRLSGTCRLCPPTRRKPLLFWTRHKKDVWNMT